MAEALAHDADVNWANSEENKATPLIQAVLGVWICTLRFSVVLKHTKAQFIWDMASALFVVLRDGLENQRS